MSAGDMHTDDTHILPLPPAGRVLVLLAPDTARPALFDMVAQMALQGPLYVLDAGNSFQGYPLARALRRRGAAAVQPETGNPAHFQLETGNALDALQRILLSRVFTCYQLAALLEDSAFIPQPILLLDFLATFYDQGVRYADRKRLLDRCLRRLEAIARQAPVAVWVRQRAAIPREALGFVDAVTRAAGQVWTPPRRPALPVLRQASLF